MIASLTNHHTTMSKQEQSEEQEHDTPAAAHGYPETIMMLKDLIDWGTVMTQPRYSGGHVGIMRSLFRDSEVLAEWVECDYQGAEAFAYKLPDGRIAIVTDYFGSCSGCDAYEGAGDEAVKNLVTQLANNARVFDSIASAVRWIDEKSRSAEHYSHHAAVHLRDDLDDLVSG